MHCGPLCRDLIEEGCPGVPCPGLYLTGLCGHRPPCQALPGKWLIADPPCDRPLQDKRYPSTVHPRQARSGTNWVQSRRIGGSEWGNLQAHLDYGLLVPVSKAGLRVNMKIYDCGLKRRAGKGGQQGQGADKIATELAADSPWALDGPLWLCMAQHASVCLCMAVYGYLPSLLYGYA